MTTKRDAVVFLFHRNGKILVEERPAAFLNNKKAIFIPSGRVEKSDADFESAMKREVAEEFDGKITINEFSYLASHYSKDVNLNFHCFLISKWDGEFPDYTIEDGRDFGRLFWITLSEYPKYMKFPSSTHFCKKLIELTKQKD